MATLTCNGSATNYDCRVRSTVSATYATSHSTPNFADGFAATSMDIGQYLSGGTYAIFRDFLNFDTSTLPSGATITQVQLTMTMVGSAAYDGLKPYDIVIVKQNSSAQWNYSNSTLRQTAWDNCFGGTQDCVWANTANLVANTPYTGLTNLDATWINPTGLTWYSLISSHDLSSTAPTALEDITLGTQANATSGSRPQLVITYTPAAGGPTPYKPWSQLAPILAM